jgi:gamma-glutamylcyclotransferase (GGCT)/AIG2-like uncharacterized protein YtfP
MDRLFVYGSLAPGRPNEHVLAGIPGKWQPAVARGTLREEGWGAALGFPGIDLRARGQQVHGFVFSSAALAPHWARLDEFEGSEYMRTLTSVTLADGTEVQAYIYALRRE